MQYIREYTESDYSQCEALVNQAWGFDRMFPHGELANIAKCMYTKGSVLASNYRRVLEIEGSVAGFIFGLNAYSKKPGRNILFGLNILWRLFRVKTNPAGRKDGLLSAIAEHEKNRSRIVKKGRSEIVLFVVSEAFQGKGFGKNLWSAFLEDCLQSGVKSIVVEANHSGAATFYEGLGFTHLADFDSPIHALATPDGKACLYEYICSRF